MQGSKKLVSFLFTFIFILKSNWSTGQELIQMAIHPNEALYVHPTENVAIFSDLKNSGTLGTLPNSVIRFMGHRWTNKQSARLVDGSFDGMSGQGGSFRFQSPKNSNQIIDNQDVNANNAFPNLTIANSGNVTLEGTDLFIRRNLNFESGHLILNNRNSVLASNSTITGFDNNKFVVTGTRSTGGFLIRHTSGLPQPDFVFPVGVNVGSYTPASLSYKGIAQNIKVRVFENVYEKATYGAQDNVNKVPRTWNVSFGAIDQSAVFSINTQHNASEEGTNFRDRRLESFLSRFSSSSGEWDKIASTGLTIGNLTSGTAIPNSFISSRTDITGVSINEFFSKAVATNSALLGLRIPQGISPNNDGLNERFVIEHLKPGDQVRIDIYNRWQTLVFRDGDYKNTFDGIGNQGGMINKELPDGTYYYILNVNAEKPITGHIIINRN